MKINRSMTELTSDPSYDLILGFEIFKKGNFLGNTVIAKLRNTDKHHVRFTIKEDDIEFSNLLLSNGFQKICIASGLTTYLQTDAFLGLDFIQKFKILDEENITSATEFVRYLPLSMDIAKLSLMRSYGHINQETIMQQVVRDDVSWLFKLQKSTTSGHKFDPKIFAKKMEVNNEEPLDSINKKSPSLR